MFPTSRELITTCSHGHIWLQRVPNIGAAVKKITTRTLKMLFWGVLLQGKLFFFPVAMVLSVLLFTDHLAEMTFVTTVFDGIFLCTTKVGILMLRMTSLMAST
jgi:hypothetical protein